MKKLLSVLMIAVLLCGALTVGVAAKPKGPTSLDSFPAFLKLIVPSLDSLTDSQVQLAVKAAKLMNYDLAKLFTTEPIASNLPISAKKILHRNGVVKYPLYQRSVIWYSVCKYLFFGWIWM
jgi:hypothetical protein